MHADALINFVAYCILVYGKLPFVCTALDMPEWMEMTEQIDRRAKQPPQVTGVSKGLKCWGAWDIACGNKAKDLTSSTVWRREAWKEEALDDIPWKDERGPSSIRRTWELFQRQRWGNFWETGWSAYGLFWELNWAEPNCVVVCIWINLVFKPRDVAS